MPNATSSYSVSVIVPCYKEADNLPLLCQRFQQITQQFDQCELIIVDDNSQDGSEELVQQLQQRYTWLRLIVRKAARSLSLSVIAGFQQAKYSILVCMDADLSHPPEKIIDMVNTLYSREADFVIGSRYVDEGKIDKQWSLLRRLSSKVSTIMAMVLVNAKDPMSGFFCLRKSTFQSAAHLNPIGYKIGLELMVKCRCKKIEEVPITFMDRQKGKSKYSLKQVIYYFRLLARLLAYKWFKR